MMSARILFLIAWSFFIADGLAYSALSFPDFSEKFSPSVVSIIALDEKGMVDTYHSLEDRPEHLDYDLLFDSYRLCIAVLDHIDSTPHP